MLRRRVFGGGEDRIERVCGEGAEERGRERERERERGRDTQAPELLLMLLMLLQPFDNSPPRESREEGRRSEQEGVSDTSVKMLLC